MMWKSILFPPRAKKERVAVLFVALVAMAIFSDSRLWGFNGGEERPHESGRSRQLPATGPLKILAENPRYFTDGTGRAIYLTGSHTWTNLVDFHRESDFDYAAYLDFLRRHNHNFIRLWSVETVFSVKNPALKNRPVPYARSGPGAALDGRPKVDLTKFDPDYFYRLRSRVMQARDLGIYVMVMLFQGFSVHDKGAGQGQPWPAHYFNAENNINGIDGDLNGNGEGEEVHTLEIPAITRLQEAYVRKVIDTLNDLDNVLYEISNESHRGSAQWQYHMIRYNKEYQKNKPKRHPVVMTHMWDGRSSTGQEDDNAALFASPADAISPGPGLEGAYRSDPPPADGRKIIIVDTDHLWGIGGNADWVWKSFLRGLNPIFMDRVEDDPKWDSSRTAMGQTLRFARRVNLAAMVPSKDLASTGYCLANPGVEYLIYLPSDSHWLESRLKSWMDSTRFVWRFSRLAEGVRPFAKLSVRVDLSQARQTFNVEWFNPGTGEFMVAGEIEGGTEQVFTAPFTGPAVLHLGKVTSKQKTVSSEN